MHVVSKTDVGLVRTENQDRVNVKQLDGDVVIVVVCDGMGGEHSGSEASQVAANIIFDRLVISYRDNYDNNSIRNLILTSINAANSIVYEKSISDENKVIMGTTCVCGIIKKDIAHIANVGDSRAYLITDEKISQITTDHSLVRMLFEQGKIQKNEIENHPQLNVITRAVGIEETIEIDYFETTLTQGSTILMCTDGLSHYCNDDSIFNIITNKNIEEASISLVDYAKKQGGKDNITVALATN